MSTRSERRLHHMLTPEREKQIRDYVENAIDELLAEIDRLRNAQCICPECATEWNVGQSIKLQSIFRKKLVGALAALETIESKQSFATTNAGTPLEKEIYAVASEAVAMIRGIGIHPPIR